MRLSRMCYDKAWRCPGWIGGGPKFATVERCDGGRILLGDDAKHWQWKFLRCDTCDVVTWPYVTRYLSLYEWAWKIKFWWRYR